MKWKKLNFSAIIQQGDFQHRGEQGLFEAVGFKLFNLAGVEGPNTNYVHFRIVENAAETAPTSTAAIFRGCIWRSSSPTGSSSSSTACPTATSTRWKAAPAS